MMGACLLATAVAWPAGLGARAADDSAGASAPTRRGCVLHINNTGTMLLRSPR